MRKPKVKLVGEDGNVFSIIGRVSQALKSYGNTLEDLVEGKRLAREFTEKAFNAGSYDEVLRLSMEYCEVS